MSCTVNCTEPIVSVVCVLEQSGCYANPRVVCHYALPARGIWGHALMPLGGCATASRLRNHDDGSWSAPGFRGR